MPKRRTKKQYTDLFDNPQLLKRQNAGDCQVILFPNGENELWVKDSNGYGFRISFGAGPAGIGVIVERFTCGPALTVSGNTVGEKSGFSIDASYVEITQHFNDEYSQKHKEWSASDVIDGKHSVKHPSELGIKPYYNTKD